MKGSFNNLLREVAGKMTFTEADGAVKQMMLTNPNLFSESMIHVALRNQPCGVYRLHSNCVDLAYLGHIGQVFKGVTGCLDGVIMPVMDGCMVMLSERQAAALNKKLQQRGATFTPVDPTTLE